MKRVLKSVLSIIIVLAILFGAAPLSGFKGVGSSLWHGLCSLAVSAKEAVEDIGKSIASAAASAEEGLEDIIENLDPVNTSDNKLAATGQCGDNVYWVFEEETGTLTISGEGKMYDYVLSSYYSSYGPFADNNSINTLVIGPFVTTISDYAFYNCNNLSNITISNSLEDIGIFAFQGTGFYNNSENWENDVLYLENCLISAKATIEGEYVVNDGTRCIAGAAFYGCQYLTSIYIPDSVINVGMNAFSVCDRLTAVHTNDINAWAQTNFAVLGGNPLCNGANLYENNELVTDVVLSGNINKIGSCAFMGYTSLTSVSIPDSVTTIGLGAFCECTGLTNITIPKNVTSIGSVAFTGTSIEEITVPASVKSLSFGDDRYLNYSSAMFEMMLSSAFFQATNLKKIIFADGTVSIPDYSLYACDQVEEVVIPDSVTNIGNYTFYGCTGLTNIDIPDSVTSIGDYAFAECLGLTNLSIPDGVTNIGNSAFQNIKFVSYQGTAEGAPWGALCINGFIDGMFLYEDESRKVLIAIQSENPGDVVLPDSITTIGNYAFAGCTGLTSITISNSVTSIGSYAFSGCTGLTSLTIGNGIKSIGDCAFYHCEGLYFDDVAIEEDVTSIANNAFYKCSNAGGLHISDIDAWAQISFDGSYSNPLCYAEELYLNGQLVKSVVLSDNVKLISSYAFYNCSSIKSITIPDSVTSIGRYAFCGCTGLTSVTIDVGLTTIGSYAFYKCKGLTSIEIPDSVTNIGSYAFYGCKGLKTITIPDSVTSIGEAAFASTANGFTIICSSWDSKYIIDYASSSAIPVEVLSNESVSGKCGENLSWNLTPKGVLTISGSGDMTEKPWESYISVIKTVQIESGVTSIINSAFYNCESLTSIEIPDSVTSIGNSAFYDCTGLTSVTIGDGVTTIGNSAFYNCTGLNSITIPNSVTSIGGCAFEYCRSLTSIMIPDSVTSIGSHAFYETKYQKNASNWENDVLYIGNYLIEAKTNIAGDYTIKNGTVCIAARAFDDCTRLTSLEIPNSVKSIGEYLLDDCTSLTSITIPFVGKDDLSNGDFDYLFRGYTGSIPASLKTVRITGGSRIGNHAFSGCSGLTSIEIPDSVTSIGNHAFSGCSGLTSITIPDSVTSIGEYAFCDCTSLTDLTIGKGVTGIGDYAFQDCTQLENMFISDIGAWAEIDFNYFRYSNPLYYAKNLYLNNELVTDVVLPDGVTSIGSSAFYGYTSLTSVEIPDSVTSIGSSAFSGCTGLTSVTIPDSVTSIGSGAFSGCSNITSITVPFVGAKKDGTSNTLFGYIFGGYYGNGSYVPSSLKTVVITGGETIGKNAFSGCTGLTSITIPDSVTSIDDYAFNNCKGLTSIEIPDSVTSISDNAFNNTANEFKIICSSLDSVYIISYATSNAIPVEVLSNESISGKCGENLSWNLTPKGVLTISGSGDMTEKPWESYISVIKTVQIESGVTSIIDSAFYNCKGLASVTIGDSVSSIGGKAFYDCSNLEGVYVTDIDAWAQISFNGVYSNPLYYANKLYLNDQLVESVVLSDNATSVSNYAFYNCSSIKSITIPDSVTGIGTGAFYGCKSLTSITIPFVGAKKDGTSYTNFGYIFGTSNYSYNNSYVPSSLKTVVITGGETIGNNAFYGCRELTNITIGNSLKSIGNYAFQNCKGLTSVTIGGSVTTIGNGAFSGCTGLTSITIPDSVTSIGSYAFKDCAGLTSVTIPDSVTNISDDAFSNTANEFKIVCSSLNSEYIINYASKKGILVEVSSNETLSGECGGNLSWVLTSKGVLTITGSGDMTEKPWALYRCVIKAVQIENGVTNIIGSAFSGCSGLTSIEIPNSVTNIGSSAFYGCTGLTGVYISDIATWAQISFKGGDSSNPLYYAKKLYLNDQLVESAVLSDNVTSISNYAFYNCKGLTSVTIGGSVTSIGSSAFSGCTGLTSVTMGDSVTSIGYRAFYGCTGLTSVTIGDGVTTIGNSTFYNCTGLNSITIPNSVTSIGRSAFSGCTGLTSVTIGDSVTSIGYEAFYDCTGLTGVYITDIDLWTQISFDGGYSNPLLYAKKLYLNDNLVESVVLSDNVKSISSYAFYNCSSIKSITIPDSVTSIGSSAFSGCTGLTSVAIPNSVTFIGNSAFWNTADGFKIICAPTGSEYILKYASNNGIPVEIISSESFSGSCGDNLTWVLSTSGVLTINGSGEMAENPWDKYCTTIKAIEIGEGVTSICSKAFYQCIALTSITIPESVTSIGSYAFCNCTELNNITIPESVTSIGNDAFYRCSNLTGVYITDIDAWAQISFVDSDSNPLCYAKKLYLNDQLVENAVLSDNVKSISSYAFYNCSSMKSITIPDSVTSIGSYAFYYCTGLNHITIPDSVTTIGYGAFYVCTGLTRVTIGDSVTSIGEKAFYACSNLEGVYITDIDAWVQISFDSSYYSNPLHYAKKLYLNDQLVESVVLSESVKSISNYAFYNCSSIKSITIPDSVTSIGNDAFYQCSNLTGVYISDIDAWTQISFVDSDSNPLYYAKKLYLNDQLVESAVLSDNVTSISNYAFYNCKGLTSVTIGGSVTSIGSSAFSGCTGLTSVTMGDSVTSIGNYAFSDCAGLTSVTMGDSVTSIGYRAFYGCSKLEGVYISDIDAWTQISFNDAYSNPLSYAKKLYLNDQLVESVVLSDNVETIKNYAFYNCTGLTSITIHNSVTSIGEYAFYGCTGLTSVTIGDSVTSIGNDAFYGCTGLASVTIGESVTRIGNYAFYNCTGLNSITIPNSVTSIGSYAFYGCTGLKIIKFSDSVDSIGENAFKGCTGLTAVALPKHLKTLGDNAFKNCSSMKSILAYDELKTIGTQAIGYLNNEIIDGFVIYCPNPSAAYNYAVSNNISSALSPDLSLPILRVNMIADGKEYLSGSSYTKHPVTVTVENIQPSNEGTVFMYSVDGGEFIEFDGTITVSDSGDLNYEFTACNALGQFCENNVICKILIDNNAPEIKGILGLTDEWSKEVVLTVNAVDSGSGIAGVSFDGGITWSSSQNSSFKSKTYTFNCTIPAGRIRVIDKLGNTAVWNEKVVIDHVDTEAPVINEITRSTTDVTRDPVVLTIDCSDSLSGLADTPYSFDGGSTWQPGASKSYSQNTTIPAGYIKVKDKAGNVTNWNESIIIDNIVDKNLIVTVVDKQGNTVPDASVFFNFGTDDQYVAKTDSNGMTKQFIEAEQTSIGVLKNGYLPAVETVSLSLVSATNITIEIEEKELVEGDFDIRRMTEEEIVESGIDLSDPENQYVCEVTCEFVFTPADPEEPEEKINYHEQIPVPRSGDCVIPLDDFKPDSPKTTKPYLYIPPIDPDPVSDEYDPFEYAYILIIDVPVEASCAKEFFNVGITMINNASSAFNVSQNELKLILPEGLTLMEGLEGFENSTVTFDSFIGQETKQFSWVVRGDIEGTYNIGAKYTGVLDGFGARYNCEFISDEVTVYGMSQLTMVVKADSDIIGGAWKISVGLRNDGDIDVIRPSIAIDADLVRCYEKYAEENSWNTLKPIVTLKNYFEIKPGESSKQEKILKYPKVLNPGQTIGATYVMKGVSSYARTLEIRDAFVKEMSGYKLKGVEFDFESNGGTVYTNIQITKEDGSKGYKTRSFSHSLEHYIFRTPSVEYNPDLANIMMWFAESAYIEGYTWESDEDPFIEQTYKSFGFEDKNIHLYNYRDYNANEQTKCAFSIASKELLDGRTLVMITVRGTGNDLHFPITGEWAGNFEIGSGGTDNGCGYHPNFEQCSNDIIGKLNELGLLNSSDNYVYCLTGHSKGGGVANLTAVSLKDRHGIKDENLYDYNFACPDVAIDFNSSWMSNSGNHNNIFNINNVSDLVTYIPALICNNFYGNLHSKIFSSWNKFGVSKWFSLNWSDISCTNLAVFLTSIIWDQGIPAEYIQGIFDDPKDAKYSYNPHAPEVYLAFTEQYNDFDSLKSRPEAEYMSGEMAADAVLKGWAIGHFDLGAEAMNYLESLIMTIMCPVDFEVIDKDGNVIAACINNEPVYYDMGDNSVLIMVDGDRKGVLIADPTDVTINILATDDGQMEFDVEHIYNIQMQQETPDVAYTDIALTSGKKIQYHIGDSDDLSKNELYVVDNNDQPIARIENDGSETKVEKFYFATFVADGVEVGKVKFAEGQKTISEPEVPHKEGFTGKWRDYTLGNEDIMITAVYSEIKKPVVTEVSIGDISLEYKSSTTLKPQIKAEEGANYTVTYSSSNPSVATVDNSGKVTSQKQFGLNRGSTVITCTVTDSNGNTVTDTCKVTVSFAWWQWLIKIALFGWIWY